MTSLDTYTFTRSVHNVTDNTTVSSSTTTVSSTMDKEVCLDMNECSIINGIEGSGIYYIIQNNQIIDFGSNDSFSPNSCSTNICDDKPLLSTLEGRAVVTLLLTVSGMDVSADADIPQYHVACWLIHDDVRGLSAVDENLIQRYVLSLLYLTTNGSYLDNEADVSMHGWKDNYHFISSKHECS